LTRESATRLYPILLLVIGAAVYANSLGGPFIFDDKPSIAAVRASGSERTETAATGRPVVRASLALNYALGGLDPRGYHACNIFLHLACALTLYGVVRRTVDSAEFALASALLWMVHPLGSECVNYVSQRSESLVALFYLLTLYCAIRAWGVAAIVCCALGMASKEVMVTAPLMVLLYDRVFGLRRGARFYAGLASTWIVLGYLMWTDPRAKSVDFSGTGSIEYALNQCVMIVRYLRLALWPQPLVLDYGVPRPITLGEAAPHALVVLVLLVVVAALLRYRPTLGYPATWFFVILAPTSSIVPILTEVGAERRVYLPLAGLVTLGVALARRSGLRGQLGALVLIVAATPLVWQTVRRNGEYWSESSIWASSVRALPDNPRARLNLGKALQAESRIEEAIGEYRIAIGLEPDFVEAHNNLGAALRFQGKAAESLGPLREAIRLAPDYPPAHYNLGLAYQTLDRADDAIRSYREALRLDPDYLMAHNNLGTLLASRGEIEEALVHFRRALEIDPAHAEARHNLEQALRQRL
jgi:Flp pilus assembly protein TadD